MPEVYSIKVEVDITQQDDLAMLLTVFKQDNPHLNFHYCFQEHEENVLSLWVVLTADDPLTFYRLGGLTMPILANRLTKSNIDRSSTLN